MTRDIRRRLEKLESQVPQQPTEQEKIALLLILAVAYYLGDPAPNESVAEAYARALGYRPGSLEFRNAFEGNDAAFCEKDRLARIKLLEKFGVSWGHEWDAIVDAFELMEAGLSESYKQRLHKIARSVMGLS
jgi:hypothetical protein